MLILRHAWLNLWDKRMLLAESTRLLSFYVISGKEQDQSIEIESYILSPGLVSRDFTQICCVVNITFWGTKWIWQTFLPRLRLKHPSSRWLEHFGYNDGYIIISLSRTSCCSEGLRVDSWSTYFLTIWCFPSYSEIMVQHLPIFSCHNLMRAKIDFTAIQLFFEPRGTNHNSIVAKVR